MTNNELFNAVDDVCELLYDGYGCNLTAKKYIGRGMNKPCLGIVFENENDLKEISCAILYYGVDYKEKFNDLITNHASYDSMGKNSIVYFQSVTLE
jgi:hypothetical protein